jgi:hypothetical protein
MVLVCGVKHGEYSGIPGRFRNTKGDIGWNVLVSSVTPYISQAKFSSPTRGSLCVHVVYASGLIVIIC